MPVLIVTGGRDEKFTALGRRMADAIGGQRHGGRGAGGRPRAAPAATRRRGRTDPYPPDLDPLGPRPMSRSSQGRRDRERDPQPQGDRQQDAEDQLQATRGRQHRQQGPALGVAPDESHRPRDQGQGHQGQEGDDRDGPTRTTPVTDSRAQTSTPTNGSTHAGHVAASRPARRPTRTASVRLPLPASVPMSRRLLANRRAVANRPTATAANHTTGACSSRVWT